jgi:protein TonB
MTARRDMPRWGACFALALCVHGAAAAALLAHMRDDGEALASAPTIMIELAPVPVARATMPNDVPPGPQQADAQIEPDPVKPVDTAVLPPAENPELTAAVPKVLEKPKDKVPKRKHASLASAPSTAERHADRAAAPAPGTNTLNADALPTWRSQLMARLERYKRYPAEAQSRGEHGEALLAFSIDRSGGAHHAHIVRSSGSAALDRETLDLVARAQPLPPPPPEMSGALIAVTVPIRYNFR